MDWINLVGYTNLIGTTLAVSLWLDGTTLNLYQVMDVALLFLK